MRSTLCIPVCALAALVAAAIAVACNDPNPPATQSSTGGTDATGGSTGENGREATGGDTAADGGEATGGDEGTDVQGTGGEFACNYPTASNPPPDGAPQCAEGLAKNEPCTEEQEGYRCYKNCGPRYASGWKPLTCTSGIFTEIPDCTWTGDDYSAFRIPATLEEMNPACPVQPPQATMPCNVDPCISCAARNAAYQDGGGTEMSAWCTCYHGANDEDPVWTCTAGEGWPCPGNPGC